MPALFRHPDGCRWLWQARFDVYFSLFARESSGSHATLSHLKENNKSFLPVWNNSPAEEWVEWGIFAPSMISARLTDRVTPTGTRVSAHTGKATRGIWRSFDLLVLTLRYLQIHTHFFFFSGTRRNLLILQLLFTESRAVMVNPLYITRSQIEGLHISPWQSPELHDSRSGCERRQW